MDQRYTTKNVQQSVGKTSGMPVWKMEKVAKQMAKQGDADAAKVVELGKKKSLSLQESRRYGEASKKIGFLKHVGVEQMVNRMKRQMADEENEAETNVSPAAFRKPNAQQSIGGTPGKPKPMTSIAQINPAKSSALSGQKNIAKGEGAFVSAARAQEKKQAPGEKKEEKPVAVDLMID